MKEKLPVPPPFVGAFSSTGIELFVGFGGVGKLAVPFPRIELVFSGGEPSQSN